MPIFSLTLTINYNHFQKFNLSLHSVILKAIDGETHCFEPIIGHSCSLMCAQSKKIKIIYITWVLSNYVCIQFCYLTKAEILKTYGIQILWLLNSLFPKFSLLYVYIYIYLDKEIYILFIYNNILNLYIYV